jgi:hypothetical protein
VITGERREIVMEDGPLNVLFSEPWAPRRTEYT